MKTSKKYVPPKEGEPIIVQGNQLKVPDNPIIPYIEGDGIGPDIMTVSRRVLDKGVERAYGGTRKICWYEIFAGAKAKERFGELLPEDTFEAIRQYRIALKGPLSTPIGGGHRSLNVTLRQVLDLYACVRPVRYIKGAPSPVKCPEKVDMVIFRENTEDVYAGIEWPQGSKEAKSIIDFLNKDYKANIPADSGIGIKPISITRTKRLMRKALEYAIAQKRRSITIVHKGNIMKYTEGAFRNWCYELAREEYGHCTITEPQLAEGYGGKQPADKIVIKDKLADDMFRFVLMRPEECDVLVMPNLNGDYLSDACNAQVGGIGLAPSANIADTCALFESAHGSAPKYAGQNKVNPSALILSGIMMLEHMDWKEAAKKVLTALEKTILQKKLTYDLARQVEGATELSTSAFGEEVIRNM
ncbi:MAG: isocitrate dehydrogenase (NADP(+)) [Planctomycetes bacterium RIFCSPHIGHO2_12_FULL_52_36]|nr:MAG: isocitrate dehydrogenase (NADP(+)) [Planctomycetes bacterium RIFCSPHIGHO2_02_FULL_52_58]OHB93633.1 MAG: isocitrate dehydrogenase (NADP(+)) [Planctomycetes bacterium RIFCSPHIGHO2_12_FULL_52_36]